LPSRATWIRPLRAAARSRALLALLAALLLLALAALGCSRAPDDSRSTLKVSGDFSTPFQVQINNFVRRQPPAVYVAPRESLNRRPRVLFVPLRMVQQIADPVSFSTAFSRQIWQVWLSLNAFQTLEYAADAGPYEPNRAMALARKRGAEMVVGGYINHYMDGGSGGTSSLSLALEIYDVRTGVLLWSMAQGGLMEARQVHDFYLFSIKERNPGDPAGFIARSLAWDMGREVLTWVDPDAVPPKTSLWDSVFGGSAF
jgi:hypothetical protein